MARDYGVIWAELRQFRGKNGCKPLKLFRFMFVAAGAGAARYHAAKLTDGFS
jgi:hypothetical protein